VAPETFSLVIPFVVRLCFRTHWRDFDFDPLEKIIRELHASLSPDIQSLVHLHILELNEISRKSTGALARLVANIESDSPKHPLRRLPFQYRINLLELPALC
jgi:hypothetical protein